MLGVKAEAGGVEPDPIPGGAAAIAQGGTVQLSGRMHIGGRGAVAITETGDSAKFEGVAGQGQVGGGDRADFRGVVGTGEAGNLAPLTVDSTAQVINNARADITLQAAVSVEAEVIRAPFSPHLISERIADNPELYRRLATNTAEEIRLSLEDIKGHSNSAQVVRSELIRVREGLLQVAQQIAEKSYDAAAKTIVALRDGFAAWYQAHPDLIDAIQKLSVITLFGYTMHQFGGATADLGVIVSAAVVNKEKIADIIKAWKGK